MRPECIPEAVCARARLRAEARGGAGMDARTGAGAPDNVNEATLRSTDIGG
jgi:hypothetical protein